MAGYEALTHVGVARSCKVANDAKTSLRNPGILVIPKVHETGKIYTGIHFGDPAGIGNARDVFDQLVGLQAYIRIGMS